MQGALEQNAIRFVIVTTRATMVRWSVLHRTLHPTGMCAAVMTITRAATVNILSMRRVLRLGGDRRSVDLATVRRIAALIQVATSRQESAAAGYVVPVSYTHLTLPTKRIV